MNPLRPIEDVLTWLLEWLHASGGLTWAWAIVATTIIVLTRLATLPLIGMALFIQLFVYPTSWPDHLIWIALLGFLLARGPGAISLDALLARQFDRNGAAMRAGA